MVVPGTMNAVSKAVASMSRRSSAARRDAAS
jgi:hypothetical protein